MVSKPLAAVEETQPYKIPVEEIQDGPGKERHDVVNALLYGSFYASLGPIAMPAHRIVDFEKAVLSVEYIDGFTGGVFIVFVGPPADVPQVVVGEVMFEGNRLALREHNMLVHPTLLDSPLTMPPNAQ